MRNRRLFSPSLSDDEETSLTPLIDVVFVVLILFILVAPMVEIDRIQLAQAPDREQPDTVSPGDLSIHVREDSTIWIHNQQIAKEKLHPLLKALHQQNPKASPQLYQDQKAPFGTYQQVKNAVEEAGFTELEVILKPN